MVEEVPKRTRRFEIYIRAESRFFELRVEARQFTLRCPPDTTRPFLTQSRRLPTRNVGLQDEELTSSNLASSQTSLLTERPQHIDIVPRSSSPDNARAWSTASTKIASNIDGPAACETARSSRTRAWSEDMFVRGPRLVRPQAGPGRKAKFRAQRGRRRAILFLGGSIPASRWAYLAFRTIRPPRRPT